MTQSPQFTPRGRSSGTPAARAESVNPVVDRTVPDLAEEFTAWLITSLAVRLSRGASSYYTRNWCIGSTEYRLVMALGREGPCSAARAAAAADIDKAAASRSLQVLQREGLVELVRSGREMEILLTAEGKTLHASLHEASQLRDGRLTSGLSAAEVARLRDDLRRLIDNLPFMNED